MRFTASAAAFFAIATLSTIEGAPVKDNRGPYHVPLHINPHFIYNATASILRTKAKYARLAPHLFSKQGVVPVTNFGSDALYYAEIDIGTPAQTLKLNFDTGSADLWFDNTSVPFYDLASTLCDNCDTDLRKFDASQSSTYENNGTQWEIEYGDGSRANGILGTDVVNLGGLVIQNQTIGLANHTQGDPQSNAVSGILGLAFDTLTSVSGVQTPVDNLVAQNLTDEPIFGVFLGKASEGGGGGEYVFGGYNSSHVDGELTGIEVDNSDGFYSVGVDSLSVGSTSIGGPFNGILDTGSTLLLLPDSIANGVASQYNATENSDGSYTIGCDSSTFQPIALTLGGKQFYVPVDSIIWYKQQEDQCIAGFGSIDSSVAIIGDTFLKNNYVIFYQAGPEVWIAPSKQ
ncbi:hypothetical protein DFQ28_004838 [Apophysomyces sp. BC1034]|nr:hypothetical protein DFQ28_004838 [Apophysomyces sp. BC1034]